MYLSSFKNLTLDTFVLIPLNLIEVGQDTDLNQMVCGTDWDRTTSEMPPFVKLLVFQSVK